jgi:hypothetical protein
MFILSVALYVLEALVFEMVGGFTTSAAPRNWRAIKGVCITLEESFENAAVVLFIHNHSAGVYQNPSRGG